VSPFFSQWGVIESIETMLKCQKCGASVSEEKAFCQDCGSPMTPAAAAHRPPPVTDFGATIIVPRGPSASGPLPPNAAPRPQVEPRSANAPNAPATSQPASRDVAQHNAPSSPAATTEPRASSRTLYVVLGIAALLFFLLIVIGLLLWLAD